MILGASEIIKRINEEQLLTETDYEDFVVEGATVDVRANTVFEHQGYSEFYITGRNTGKIDSVLPDENGIYELHPWTSYLISTIESVNMPLDLLGIIETRTTMFRGGCLIRGTYVDPGYSGILNVMFCNFTPTLVKLERGSRIAQIGFWKVDGECKKYHGKWYGGVMHSDGKFIDPR